MNEEWKRCTAEGYPPKEDCVKSRLNSYNLGGHNPVRLGGCWRRPQSNNTCRSVQYSFVARLRTYSCDRIRISLPVLLS